MARRFATLDVFTGDALAGNIAFFVYTAPELVRRALERLRACGRSRVLSSHHGARSASALDHALFYLDALERRETTALESAPLEDFLPEGVLATDFERAYHRRNVAHLLANGAVVAIA